MHVVPDEPLDWVEANQLYIAAAIRVLRLRVLRHAGSGYDDGELANAEKAQTAAVEQLPGPASIDSIAQAFGLSEFERDLLLLCAGVEMDAAVADACALSHGDTAGRYVTFGLGLAVLASPHWSALTPAGPLRRWRLLDLDRPEVLTTSPLRVDERVLHALAGISYLDEGVGSVAEIVKGPIELPPSAREAVRQVTEQLTTLASGAGIQLYGRQHCDVLAVACAAAHDLGLRALRVRVSDVAGSATDREAWARILAREAVLSGLLVVVDLDNAAPETAELALDLDRRLDCPTVLAARDPITAADPRPFTVSVQPPTTVEARQIWETALGPANSRITDWLDAAVGQFELGAETMRAVADDVRPSLEDGAASTSTDGNAVGLRLWEHCRAQARPSLGTLAQRIEPRAGWADLVLPALQLRTLRQVAVHVRHRLVVHEDWGFADRTSRGLGTAALFSGASGTGKTLAAEVLAADLRLDLYRIDLSQVVSKYIGETEKNLRTVFDAADSGGAVLLFDEADALFGKRSEVKDSHDRYANIEVSYLLQRMEAYRGLAILTTNLKSSLDPAFMRRLRFVVQFPFPEAAQRAEIWRRAFPAATPQRGLDPRRLASLTISGGTIANIALLAAFLAADAGEPVRTAHVLAAARTEYAKLERPLTSAEVRGWDV